MHRERLTRLEQTEGTLDLPNEVGRRAGRNSGSGPQRQQRRRREQSRFAQLWSTAPWPRGEPEGG